MLAEGQVMAPCQGTATTVPAKSSQMKSEAH